MANLRALAVQAARAYGIDPQIFLRQIAQESGFNPNARSSAGALGIAQFMPATARSAGVDPLNPHSALYGAAKMDAANLSKYHNWQDVLSLYNSGRGWSQGHNIGETRNYVKSILGGLNSAGGGSVPSPSMDPGAAPTSAAPDLSGVRAGILQGLIAANQAQGQHQTPNYAPVFAGLAQLRSGATSSAPAPSMGPSPGATSGGPSLINFDGKPVASWIGQILKQARAAGWKGTVESGYRSVAEQRRIYNSGVRPAAKPGHSNHNFTAFPGGAIDVTDAAGLAHVLNRLGVTSLVWAGNKDPVHFSHPHGGSY